MSAIMSITIGLVRCPTNHFPVHLIIITPGTYTLAPNVCIDLLKNNISSIITITIKLVALSL